MIKQDLRPVIVSIQCLVYNHEPYLRDCLNGFVMQKTTFRFEAIVHDDVSTDKSVEIIKEYAEKYPDIIKPIYEIENQFSKRDGSLGRIMNNACQGKYIAYCEGDDYWTDPYKLQKQVDVLEQHPEVMLVHTNYRTVDNNCNPITRIDFEFLKSKIRSGQVFHHMIRRNFVLTATVCLRREVIFENNLRESNSQLDYCYYINAAAMGNLLYIPDVTADYRLAPESLTQKHYYWSEHQAAKVYEYYAELFIKNKLKKFSWWDKQKTNYSIMAREIEVIRGRRIGHESVVKKHPWLWAYSFIYPFEVIIGKIKI